MTDVQKKFEEWEGRQTTGDEMEFYSKNFHDSFTANRALGFYAGYHANKNKPMTIVEIEQFFIDHKLNRKLKYDMETLRAIQPLTVQQGFVPDWSNAPNWATHLEVNWVDSGSPVSVDISEHILSIPRPQKDLRSEIECKTGRKTDGLTDAEVETVAKFLGLAK